MSLSGFKTLNDVIVHRITNRVIGSSGRGFLKIIQIWAKVLKISKYGHWGFFGPRVKGQGSNFEIYRAKGSKNIIPGSTHFFWNLPRVFLGHPFQILWLLEFLGFIRVLIHIKKKFDSYKKKSQILNPNGS